MGGCVGRSVGRSVGRPSPPSADPRVRERAGCCQCAKEYQVVRAHSGFNSGTVASCDGCRRLMFEFYTGMHTSLRLFSSFLNMSPLCASEGRAAGVGPKDRLGRRQCRRREREGCGTAIERARAGGRRTSERASVLQTPTAAGTTATAAHGLFSPDRPTERPTDRGPPLLRPFVRRAILARRRPGPLSSEFSARSHLGVGPLARSLLGLPTPGLLIFLGLEGRLQRSASFREFQDDKFFKMIQQSESYSLSKLAISASFLRPERLSSNSYHFVPPLGPRERERRERGGGRRYRAGALCPLPLSLSAAPSFTRPQSIRERERGGKGESDPFLWRRGGEDETATALCCSWSPAAAAPPSMSLLKW